MHDRVQNHKCRCQTQAERTRRCCCNKKQPVRFVMSDKLTGILLSLWWSMLFQRKYRFMLDQYAYQSHESRKNKQQTHAEWTRTCCCNKNQFGQRKQCFFHWTMTFLLNTLHKHLALVHSMVCLTCVLQRHISLKKTRDLILWQVLYIIQIAKSLGWRTLVDYLQYIGHPHTRLHRCNLARNVFSIKIKHYVIRMLSSYNCFFYDKHEYLSGGFNPCIGYKHNHCLPGDIINSATGSQEASGSVHSQNMAIQHQDDWTPGSWS